jgi:hypothetical protein
VTHGKTNIKSSSRLSRVHRNHLMNLPAAGSSLSNPQSKQFATPDLEQHDVMSYVDRCSKSVTVSGQPQAPVHLLRRKKPGEKGTRC